MMIKTALNLIPLLVIIISSCTNPVQDKKEDLPEINGVTGSWNLDQYIDHVNKGQDWISYDDTILYQKHITDSHFTWFKYDSKNNNLLGMGGGNYKIEKGNYIENIEFFYPPGSSELGQAIPFNLKFEKGMWYHSGMAKEYELDIETGDMEEVGTIMIEEIWKPTKSITNPDSKIQKTWDLRQYRTGLSLEYIEYPDFTGYIKLITPTHFVWTKYDKEGDEIYGAGAGTYLFKDDLYIESINIIHPENTGQVGSSIKFDFDVNDNKWKHFGYVPDFVVDENNGDIRNDSILIDEYWIPHEKEFTEEIFF
ncbi:MAG: hypothetical protein ACJA0X_002332 [Cyclobacteriaceae bacterium]|jgi:hypothetical protein